MGALAGSSALLSVTRRAYGEAGFGDLETDPAGILDLPAGFSYVLLQTAGDLMSDGIAVPASPDAMACFLSADGNYILMRNQEEEYGTSPAPDMAFDPAAIGGVTRVVVDPVTLSVVSSNLVLTGTVRNCAGGPSPYGWLTCEETEDEGHGYVFLTNASATSVEAPQQFPTLGRFEHESASFDKSTSITYLTEDTDDSAFYRHIPDDVNDPFVGKLQALKIVGQDVFDTSAAGVTVGASYAVEWVDVADPEGLAQETRYQAQDLGAAIFVRGEGSWIKGNSLWFTCTEGGPTGQGQVWRLDLDPQGDTLTLIAQAEGDGELANPDNITSTPWGDVIACEDTGGVNHLRGITPEGLVYTFARNAVDGGFNEFAGACFSPDGRVLFVNLQSPGYTLAITGPFPEPEGMEICGCL
jgi:secreted PhoX family phosphatase